MIQKPIALPSSEMPPESDFFKKISFAALVSHTFCFLEMRFLAILLGKEESQKDPRAAERQRETLSGKTR